MHKAPVLTRSEELITAELTNGGSGPIWDALVNNVQCGFDYLGTEPTIGVDPTTATITTDAVLENISYHQ